MYFTDCIKHIYNVSLMDAFAYFSDGHVSVHLSMLWKLVLKKLDTCFETSNTSRHHVSFFFFFYEKSTGQIGEQLNTFWLSRFTFTQQFWGPHLVFWENVMVLSFYKGSISEVTSATLTFWEEPRRSTRERAWSRIIWKVAERFHSSPSERNPQPSSV